VYANVQGREGDHIDHSIADRAHAERMRREKKHQYWSYRGEHHAHLEDVGVVQEELLGNPSDN
jgi:hypothetical protein